MIQLATLTSNHEKDWNDRSAVQESTVCTRAMLTFGRIKRRFDLWKTSGAAGLENLHHFQQHLDTALDFERHRLTEAGLKQKRA